MYITKYWKLLLGHPAHVVVTGPVEYSAQATYADFIANAAVGEFGFYNADTNALISGLGAVGATVRIFGVVKRANNKDGTNNVHKTPIFTVGELSKKTRTAYQAPAAAVIKTSAFPASPVAGTVYELSILERTPGYEPFPNFTYRVKAATGETRATLIGKFVTAINSGTSFENKNVDIIVTAAAADGNTTLQLTAKHPLIRFKLLFRDGLEGLTQSVTTTPTVGTGYFEFVKAMESISVVGQGLTTQYPQEGTAPDEYGRTESVITSANQFNIYELELPRKTRTQSTAGFENKQYIILAVNSNGAANPEAEVKAILGL